MKKIKIILIFILVLSVGSFGFVYPQQKKSQEIKKPVTILKISAILITQPKAGDKWFLGEKCEIHYKLINIKTAHRVRLLKGGKYLGDFAGGNDIGTHSIKLAITCGKPLLNGVKYGPGKDYQVEVAAVDSKIKAERSGFFSILLKLAPKHVNNFPGK
jgi:hypothetical protein